MACRNNSGSYRLTGSTSLITVALVTTLMLLAGCQRSELVTSNPQQQAILSGRDHVVVMNNTKRINMIQLAGYNWQLQQATDADSKPVDVLNRLKSQVVLQFYQNQAQKNQLSFGVGCNQMGASFQLNGNHSQLHQLVVNSITSTQMLCDAPLNQAERLLAKLMQGRSQLNFEQQSDTTAMLIQTTESGYSLLWQGTQTAEAHHQQARDTVFWQIDHQPQQCPNPDDGVTCLKAREVFYDA